MPLKPGTTLGSYSVTAKIGEGGMGQVYRGTDTKLNCQVALKILPEAFASDPDRGPVPAMMAERGIAGHHPRESAFAVPGESGGVQQAGS